jgi:hypothetical protein
MGMQLPPELADVAADAGVKWPEADEDKMRGTAQAWRDAGTKLTTLTTDADHAAQGALNSVTGSTGEAARRHWSTFVAPDTGHLTASAHGCNTAANRLDHAADQVGAAKVEIVRNLICLAKNKDAAHSAAGAGHPTALLGLDTVVRGTAANVTNITNNLVTAVQPASGVDMAGVQNVVNPNPGTHGPVSAVVDPLVGSGDQSVVSTVVDPVVRGVADPVVSTVVDPVGHGPGVVDPGGPGHGPGVVSGVVDPVVRGVADPAVQVVDPGPGPGGGHGPGPAFGHPDVTGPVHVDLPTPPAGQTMQAGLAPGAILDPAAGTHLPPNAPGQLPPSGPGGPNPILGGGPGGPGPGGPAPGGAPLPGPGGPVPAPGAGRAGGALPGGGALPAPVPAGRAGTVLPGPGGGAVPGESGARPGPTPGPGAGPRPGGPGAVPVPSPGGAAPAPGAPGPVAPGPGAPAKQGPGAVVPAPGGPPPVAGGKPGAELLEPGAGAKPVAPGALAKGQLSSAVPPVPVAPITQATPAPVGPPPPTPEDAAMLFWVHMFPIGHMPVVSDRPARQLPPPPEELDYAPGLRFEPGDHPQHHTIRATMGEQASSQGLPAGHPDVAELAEGYDPLGGQHERDWDRRYLVRLGSVTPQGISSEGKEFAWPPGEVHPEGGTATGDPELLPEGTLIDRFGSPHGRVFSADATPFARRSLPPDALDAGYHRYRVERPLPVHRTISAPWFGQPGGGERYRTTYTAEELVAFGYLTDLTGGEA